MEANRKQETEFDAAVDGSTWHIAAVWVSSASVPCWYDGWQERDGVKFYRTFSPDEVQSPQITQGE